MTCGSAWESTMWHPPLHPCEVYIQWVGVIVSYPCRCSLARVSGGLTVPLHTSLSRIISLSPSHFLSHGIRAEVSFLSFLHPPPLPSLPPLPSPSLSSSRHTLSKNSKLAASLLSSRDRVGVGPYANDTNNSSVSSGGEYFLF